MRGHPLPRTKLHTRRRESSPHFSATTQVLEKKELLLTNLDRAAELEASLAPVFAGASALKASTDKLRSELLVPYGQLQEKALHLENIQGAAELLRRVLRHLFLTKKLKTQLSGGVRELSKAAQTLYELQECHAGGGLQGVRVVEAELPWIKDTTGMIMGQAERLLLHGVETLNQADLGSALQVFFNLHLLGDKVKLAMQSVMRTAHTALQTALDVSTFPEDKRGGGPGNISRGGHGGVPSAGSSASWRSTLTGSACAPVDAFARADHFFRFYPVIRFLFFERDLDLVAHIFLLGTLLQHAHKQKEKHDTQTEKQFADRKRRIQAGAWQPNG